MIIGNGQIAASLQKYESDDMIFFASGVANSACIEQSQFDREESLLKDSLLNCEGKFIYFSSCALSALGYPLNRYYEHKRKMEGLITDIAKNFLIIRLPQVLGDFKPHGTIFNFFLNSIISGSPFSIRKGAYRYVIDIDDATYMAHAIASTFSADLIVDLANPYRYSALEIVQALETTLGIHGNYSIVENDDAYIIDTSECERVLLSLGIDCGFGEAYLLRNLKYRVDRYQNSLSCL